MTICHPLCENVSYVSNQASVWIQQYYNCIGVCVEDR